MRMDRRTTVSAAVLLACSAMFAVDSWVSPAAAAKFGAPPFCVMRGGPRGPGSVPQICGFFDYQQCLQAAANLNGNCVVNIDYHGEVWTSSVPAGTRYRR
jgi:hypothetical protein